MTEKQLPDFIFHCMKSLNLFILLYIAGVTAGGLKGYIHENSALDILTQMERVPIVPWKLPVLVILLYAAFLLLLFVQTESNMGFFLKICAEMSLCLVLDYSLGFSYTGMVLLILADAMRYFYKSKWRLIFIIGICVIYLFMDSDLLSAKFKVTSLETYLGYYRNDIQSILLGIKNVYISFNIMLFLAYMIAMVRAQMNEKERILILNNELKIANRKLEEYAKESEKTAETRERNRLAREIHDTIGHALTGIITGLDACITLIDVSPKVAKEQLKLVADVARNGMTDVRRSVKALRPDALEKFDLEKALAQMLEEIKKTTHTQIEYRCKTGLSGFNDDEEDVIYRIVQECTTNSIRHGKADRIQIDIDKHYGMLFVRIADNGIGCTDIQKGFGLYHMEERLHLLQGSLEYHGENGFVVEAKIPIRWGHEDNQKPIEQQMGD